MSPEEAAISVSLLADSVIAEQRNRIATLEAEMRELKTELQRRAKQIGVACMKHDLTHSLTCGHCYTESKQQVEQLRNALLLVMECGAINQANDTELDICFECGDAAIKRQANA